MTERAEILYIVFKYIYPEPPHPKLDDMEFALLEELAITADKYQFTSLLYICDPRMERVSCFNSSQGTYHHPHRNRAESEPAAVLKYLACRNDSDMLDRVAVHTLSIPIGDAVQTFDSVLFRRWVSRSTLIGCY